MITEQKIKVVFIFIFGGILLSVFLLKLNRLNNENRELQIEFPYLETEDYVNNVVSKRHTFTRYLCYTVYVTFDDGSMYCIDCRVNFDSSDQCIYNILYEGDSVRKLSDNDTLEVIKRNSKEISFFILDSKEER